MNKAILVALLSVLLFHSVNPGPAYNGKSRRSGDSSEAEHLRNLVRKMIEYVNSVSEELKSYDAKLAQAERDGKDPHGMVIAAEDTEEPNTAEVSTEQPSTTTTGKIDSSSKPSPTDECQCDCRKQNEREDTESAGLSRRTVENDNVMRILKSIRELLQESGE